MTAPLPRPPREVAVIDDLQVLAPGFRRALDATLDGMRADGHDPMVFETQRTQERQSFLYWFGRRYDDGRGIVTHSHDADESWHFFCLAADVISLSMQWDAPDAFWGSLHRHARANGLVSGADWNNNGDTTDERFVDRPHVQFGGGMRRSPSPRAARLFAEGGLPAVWAAVGAAA